MNAISLSLLFSLLTLCLLLSAFFSCAETSIMAVNRYKLKQQTRLGRRAARRILALQSRPDRFLGTVLVGRTVSNLAAAQLVTLAGLQLGGSTGVALAGGLLAFGLLLLAETAPRTLAAAWPEATARVTSFFMHGLIVLFTPLIWAAKGITAGLLHFNQWVTPSRPDKLEPEELRLLMADVFLPVQHRKMLLGVLELDEITVNDIMVPRQEVVGVNLDDDISDIQSQLRTIQHTRIPLYKGELNDTIGILHVRNATRFMGREHLTKAEILQYAREPYYIPEGTSLRTQLLAFQKLKRRYALVVDEYGDVQGIVTLEDILEEIVGDFTSSYSESHKEITPEDDGCYLIEGSATIRDINRSLHWNLPNSGPRTLNGLILEHLETIPESPLSLRLGAYCIEIMQTKDNAVKIARVWKD